jgi:hypothetical protein
MPSPQKAKGSGFEREVAKYLTDTYGETFIRNISGSGAYVGGTNNFRKQNLTEAQIRHAKGDVVPPESFPLFNAECKFYGDFGFHQLLDSSTQLDTWLNQLMDAADPHDLNILFFKINRRGKYVAVQAIHHWNLQCSHSRYLSSRHGEWMIYSFENFFKLNTDNLRYFSGTKPVREAQQIDTTLTQISS